MSPNERANLRFFRLSLIVLIVAMLVIVTMAFGWPALACLLFTSFMASLFTLVDHMLGEDKKARKAAKS